MATKKISDLTAISTIADTDVLPIVDISETETKKISYSQLTGGAKATEIGYLTGLTSNAQAQFNSKAMDMYVKTGWYPIINTATYVSWDATVSTGVINFTGNVTGILSVGMKLKLTQTTIKFAIVTAVGTYSGGVTPVTCYFGTDYTLANATITSPYFSTQNNPYAFPLDRDKWDIVAYAISDMNLNHPNINQWYDIFSKKVPVGRWTPSFKFFLYMFNDTPIVMRAEYGIGSDTETILANSVCHKEATDSSIAETVQSELAPINVTTAITYYLKFKQVTVGYQGLYMINSVPAKMVFKCAYL